MDKTVLQSELAALRKEAGYSIRGLAQALDMPATTYQNYESNYKKDYLPPDLAKKLAGVLGKRGIASARVLRMTGVTNIAPVPASRAPASEIPPSRESRAHGSEGMVADFPLGRDQVKIKVMDISAGAGSEVAYDIDYEDQERALIVGYWVMPLAVLRSHTLADPDQLAIIQFKGDSMSPMFNHGDWGLVDLSDRNPSQPGPFIIYDGYGLLCKLVEIDSQAGEAMISSKNPAYKTFRVDPGELHINARVLGRWQWV